MTTETPQFPHTVYSLMRPRLNIHLSGSSTKQTNNILLHGGFETSNLGPFQNERDINVPNGISISRHDFVCIFHKFGGIASLPSGVGVLKDLSNIGEGECSEDGIDDGMVDDVSVGVGAYS